jgi:hypothetical protein
MLFRYFAVSLVKWFAVNAATVVVLFLVLPKNWSGGEISAPIWIMTFAIAVGFAYWALNKRKPGYKDVLKLLVVWLVVTLVMQNAFDYFIIGRALFILRSFDALAALIIELLGVIVGAIILRWRFAGKARQIVSEMS